MNITFDVSAFERDPLSLIEILSRLSWQNYNFVSPEIEAITCKTPSSAYKYVQRVRPRTNGLGAEAEKVFLRNPNIALRYLRLVNRDHFLDEKTQKRFWKKVTKNPEYALSWSKTFNKRLAETEEEVFVKDFRCAKEYAHFVIKGKFTEKVHQMLVLKSFEDAPAYQKSCLRDYIKYSEAASHPYAVPPVK